MEHARQYYLLPDPGQTVGRINLALDKEIESRKNKELGNELFGTGGLSRDGSSLADCVCHDPRIARIAEQDV
jgi:hypothetical protein